MKYILAVIYCSVLSFANEYYFSFNKKVVLNKIYENRSVDNNITYYLTPNNNKIGVNDEIILQCNNNIDCNKLLISLNFKNISKISNNIFLIKLTKTQKDNIFEISRMLSKNTSIKYSHPNFIKNKKRR